MLRAAKRSLKAAGMIVPSTMLHRFATCVIGMVPRLRATAWLYARDDNSGAPNARDDNVGVARNAMKFVACNTMVSKPLMQVLWGLGPLIVSLKPLWGLGPLIVSLRLLSRHRHLGDAE
jgi:hypothetical protein